jgi:hypothetical protein
VSGHRIGQLSPIERKVSKTKGRKSIAALRALNAERGKDSTKRLKGWP